MNSYSNFKLVTVATLYAFLIISLVVSYEFKDFSNYQEHITTSHIFLLNNYNSGLANFLINEPLYKIFVYILSFIPINEPILILYGLTSFIFAYVIFTRPNLNYFYVILLLVSPFLIRYQLIQVRQGLAIGIFSLAYYSNRAFYKYLFYIITPFVHSVFFLVYPVLVLHTLLKRYKFSFNQRYIIIITTTFGLYLIALYVADILGHRAYSRLIEDQINVSGYNFIYYLIYFFYFIFSGRSVKDNFDIPIYFISLYLLSYFIFPFAGRVFGAISLIILISLFELKLSPKNKIVLVCFYLFNLILDWYFRFSKDGFGFLEIIY